MGLDLVNLVSYGSKSLHVGNTVLVLEHIVWSCSSIVLGRENRWFFSMNHGWTTPWGSISENRMNLPTGTYHSCMSCCLFILLDHKTTEIDLVGWRRRNKCL